MGEFVKLQRCQNPHCGALTPQRIHTMKLGGAAVCGECFFELERTREQLAAVVPIKAAPYQMARRARPRHVLLRWWPFERGGVAR